MSRAVTWHMWLPAAPMWMHHVVGVNGVDDALAKGFEASSDTPIRSTVHLTRLLAAR